MVPFVCILIMMFTWFLEYHIGRIQYRYYRETKCEDVCPICLEKFTDDNPAVVLEICYRPGKNNHLYHEDCILFHANHSDHCPMCRKNFKNDRILKTVGINTENFQYL